MYYAPPGIYYQTIVPISGDTISMDDNSLNGGLYINPAGTLATLTVNLPSNVASALGQTRTITSAKTLTVITTNQIGGGVTLLNPVLSMTAGDSVTYRKVAANLWARDL